jgi:DNA-binding transcriptional LysR family regulator
MKRTSPAPLDLKQLHYFVTVAEELSLSRAARKLNISQPPLTRQIRFIEEALEATLFIRTARGVELTPAGQVLLADAKHLIHVAHQTFARARMAGAGEAGRIAIGGFGAQMLDAVPKFLRKFREDHPAVSISLQTLNRPQQIEALRDERIDAAFNRRGTYPDDIVSELLAQDKLVAALPSSDGLASRNRVALRELAGRPLIVQGSGPRPNLTDSLLSMCERAGFHVSAAQEVGDSLTAVALVAGGFGVALVARSVTYLRLPGVVYVPVSDAGAGVADIVCIYRRTNKSPVLGVFLEELRAFRARSPARQRE